MFRFVLLGCMLFGSMSTVIAGEKYFSKNATISFDAEGKLDDVEEIKAKTSQALCVYDSSTGDFQWSVPVKSFTFASSLMQDHFNENYLETEKYPKSTFVGKVENPQNVFLDKDGIYPVMVVGKLTMHGVTKETRVKGTFSVKSGVISVASSFEVLFKDYQITIPSLVFTKVAESAKISVSAVLQLLKK